MPSHNKFLNTKLRRIVKHSGLSRKLVAHLAGLGLEVFNNYYYGRNVPRADSAMRIAQVLNRSVEEIWTLPARTSHDIDTRIANNCEIVRIHNLQMRIREFDNHAWIGTDSLLSTQRAWLGLSKKEK